MLNEKKRHSYRTPFANLTVILSVISYNLCGVFVLKKMFYAIPLWAISYIVGKKLYCQSDKRKSGGESPEYSSGLTYSQTVLSDEIIR